MPDMSNQQVATGVAPPHSLDAETSVLGGLLLSGVALRALVDEERLRPEHFYRERHRLIFAAMCELFNQADRPDEHVLDVLTVSEHLRAKGQLEEVGGKGEIDALTGGVPGLGGLRKYAQIVKHHWVKRTQLSATYQMQVGIHNNDEETFNAGRKMLDELVIAPPGVTHLVERPQVALHMMKWLSEKREPGFPMPWPGLQRMLAARRGHGTVVAAWTNLGKSQFAFQWMAHVARKLPEARCVAWINEMTREEHWARQITRETAIPYEELMAGDIHNRERHKHLDHNRLLRAVGELPFGIVEAHDDTAEDIARHIRQVRPDFAIVDHFHALPNVGKTADADNALGVLLAAAAKANCHIVIVAQLNNARNVGDKPPAPTLRDLRNTGALAQLPSNVVLLHRDAEAIEDTDSNDTKYQFGSTGYAHLAKQRGGSVGIVPLTFEDERLRFIERDKRFW